MGDRFAVGTALRSEVCELEGEVPGCALNTTRQLGDSGYSFGSCRKRMPGESLERLQALYDRVESDLLPDTVQKMFTDEEADAAGDRNAFIHAGDQVATVLDEKASLQGVASKRRSHRLPA